MCRVLASQSKNLSSKTAIETRPCFVGRVEFHNGIAPVVGVPSDARQAWVCRKRFGSVMNPFWFTKKKTPRHRPEGFLSSGYWTRTSDKAVNSRLLYQLS